MDPALSALFAQSAGPVQKPIKKDRTIVENVVTRRHNEGLVAVESASAGEDAQKPNISVDAVTKERKKKQKKRKRDDVLLEDLYMSKLTEKPFKVTKTKSDSTARDKTAPIKPLGESDSEDDVDDSPTARDAGKSDTDTDSDANDAESDASYVSATAVAAEGSMPRHETQQRQDRELEKAKATVFVGNLPTSVITSHTDYKALKALFSTYGKVKSIRFRSIAFSELLPRKVAFLQNKLHPERDTLNAYVVFGSPQEARAALILNGHHFLSRKHVRVDSVAHPAPTNNRHCVFVGSVPFDAEEELLWTHFATAGEIVRVRLVRDKKTNVGKGFAYVEFKDASSVQSALLLHERKMTLGEGKGTRKLRVVRASHMPSKHRADQRERDQLANDALKPRDKAKLGRVKNLMGSQAAAKLKLLQKEIALEGERAKAPDGEKTRKGRKKSKKDVARSKARAAAYRKAETTTTTGGAKA